MGVKGMRKTLAQRISELHNPVSVEVDPEDDVGVTKDDVSESEDEHSGDDLAETEHYAQVGKSKLRKQEEVNLGPRYSGSHISRKALFNPEESDEEISSNTDVGDSCIRNSLEPENSEPSSSSDDQEIDSDEEKSESPSPALNAKEMTSKYGKAPSSKKRKETAKNYTSKNVDSSGSDDNSDSSDGESHDSDRDNDKIRQLEIQKIMKEDQKTIISTISQATKADLEKGKAVRAQRVRFDSLLNVRMVMQKALIAVNSMVALKDNGTYELKNEPYESAEEAALKLWNRLNNFRHGLPMGTPANKIGQKRKRDIDITTNSSDIWGKMQDLEVASIDQRRSTLEKWSAKTKGTIAIPLTEKFRTTNSQQSITVVLNDQLANCERLVKRTRIPRSCAPIQRDLKLEEDINIYDDGNFYQMLLKELVEQRRSESLNKPIEVNGEKVTQWTALKEAKTRKVVDTRASKGRKMRFTVHEKLQNFTAPEDRSTWEPIAVDRLFSTLLGRSSTLDEDGQDEASGTELEEEKSLRLFRS